MANRNLFVVNTDRVVRKEKLVVKAWINIFRPGRDAPIEMCGYGSSRTKAINNLESLAKGSDIKLLY